MLINYRNDDDSNSNNSDSSSSNWQQKRDQLIATKSIKIYFSKFQLVIYVESLQSELGPHLILLSFTLILLPLFFFMLLLPLLFFLLLFA